MTNLGKNVEQTFADDEENGNSEATSFLQSVSINDTTEFTKDMAGEEHTRKKQKKEKASTYSSPWQEELFQHLTTAAQACVLLYVVLIIYYCFSGDFLFFTWHPLLMSTGWMFLMTEAILVMSKDNLFTGTLSKKMRVRLHWVFQTIGLILILIGFTIVYINKNNLNKSHFKSWHGLFGFIGIIGAILTCLDGVAALYHGDLRNYIRPKINKFIHIANGVITFGCGGLALILSVYTKWFARQSSESILIFLLGLTLVLIPTIWTFTRPAIGCLRRLKDMLTEKRDQ